MYKSLRSADKIAKPDAIAITLPSGVKRVPKKYAALDKQLDGSIAALIKRAEFSADAGSLTCVYPAKGPSRLYVIGLGDVKQDDTLRALRVGAASLVRAASKAKVGSLLFKDGDAVDADSAGRAIGEGLSIGAFEFVDHKGAATDKADPGPRTLRIVIDPAMRKGLKNALTVGESANMARRLAATPPNVANPAYLVKFARKMARQVGLKCSVIDAKMARELGMGGLAAVGKAGSTPPALIMLEHAPRGKTKDAPVMLVGKAITFDTGGYSLKISGSMANMKYDKCGGMAVLGAMHAIASLKLPVRVVGLIAAAENMIDAGAYRVDDILTMYNGVTVEVTNTDAEGRLVLADALAYGCKQYKPAAIVDLATLTGGVVVAFGEYCAGMFCGDDKLATRLTESGRATGERLWPLPLWPEHRKQMKSTHADIANSAGRGAHPIQGAAFLSYFVDENVPWAHLDIAGVADVSGDKDFAGLYPKGPTAFGVRLLTRALESWR
ncbi:leucyl aminopeptidase [Planctomycetales bacterium ZRK34]|nr:leucyl aminopeptidase [Planctomycetales bacterium ZRK34]